jgi:hypothetical protein
VTTVTGGLGISQPRSVDLLPPRLQTIPEAICKNIAIARARTRSRIMAVVKADGYGHGAITVARSAIAAGAEWLGTTDIAKRVCIILVILRHVVTQHVQHIDWRRADGIASLWTLASAWAALAQQLSTGCRALAAVY